MNTQSQYPADILGMHPDEMRRLGHRVVDIVVDRLSCRHEERAIQCGNPGELLAQLGGAIPNEAIDVDTSIDLLTTVALANQQHGDHPRYFARVPGPSSYAAILGEWLATGYNTIAASWGGGAGPATIELIVIDWLRELMGLPSGTEGICVSGGSIANMTGLGAARATYGLGVAYLTDQTHSSLSRVLKEMGFPKSHIRVLPSDSGCRMSISHLKAAIQEDRQNKLKPLVVAATAGTTNTGAVDPLHKIADICAENNMWFHIDGAYGAPAALCGQGREYLAGIGRADSLVLDPHKWLFQPYDIGCVLVSRPGALEKAYSMTPEYLKDVKGADQEVDMRNRSLELTRRSRAAKLWMTFRTYGLKKIRDAVQRGIDLGEFAESEIQRSPETWRLVTPSQIGIVTFAHKRANEITHEMRAKRLASEGFAAVSSTILKGQPVLRLCTINPLTTEQDISETLRRLGES